MDDRTSIIVEGVSKKFCKSLRRSMIYGMKDIARNTFGLSSHSDRLRTDEFWAVDDVTFEVKKGESFGIIGPNGSGKSTILKMLNGIYWPDKGKIAINGRVGALIEVGAGFHPLLTGRENIYINAAILGMSKEETDKKLDDIIKFADIGDFIDSPVKNYSSGMYVRLGFSIAVHCEPEILLVDEVLSVGDGSFRQKCIMKLDEYRRTTGATVVFVSHDLYTVRRFCEKGINLLNGRTVKFGDISEVIQEHQMILNEMIKKNSSEVNKAINPVAVTKDIEIIDAKLLDKNRQGKNKFSTGDEILIEIKYNSKKLIDSPKFEVSIRRHDGELIALLSPYIDNIDFQKVSPGLGRIDCHIKEIPLLSNRYYVDVGIFDPTGKIRYDWRYGQAYDNLSFEVLPNEISSFLGQYTGLLTLKSTWVKS